MTVRVAAIGDMHFGADSGGRFRAHWDHVREAADVLLLAGDLTTHGDPREAEVLVRELAGAGVPVVAVLGNHEYHCERQDEVRRTLEQAGVTVLEGESLVLAVGDRTLGIAGTKGFGGGFVGACAHRFGEPEMKAFVERAEEAATRLRENLSSLDTDRRVALLHYSPVEGTLEGERLEIYPFLGSYLLGEAVDTGGADLVVHGHAHRGRERGVTPGGVPVRNVAFPVLGRAYALYHLDGGRSAEPRYRSGSTLG